MANIQIVQQYFQYLNQAIRTRDFSQVLKMFAEDATLYFMGSPKRGKEAIKQFFQNFPVGRIKASKIVLQKGAITADFEQQISDVQRPIKATLTFTIEGGKIKDLSVEAPRKELLL